MMFTAAFLKHYPTPWRIQDREVVDCHGDQVQGFEADTRHGCALGWGA